MATEEVKCTPLLLKRSNAVGKRHVAAMESDAGGFVPVVFGWTPTTQVSNWSEAGRKPLSPTTCITSAEGSWGGHWAA